MTLEKGATLHLLSSFFRRPHLRRLLVDSLDHGPDAIRHVVELYRETDYALGPVAGLSIHAGEEPSVLVSVADVQGTASPSNLPNDTRPDGNFYVLDLVPAVHTRERGGDVVYEVERDTVAIQDIVRRVHDFRDDRVCEEV